MKRIAVIGSGISGLGAARELARDHSVTLFEADSHLGGHAHTVDVTLDGVTHGVDTGFLVFNHRTYPNLLALFNELQVPTAPADMGFSVKLQQADVEWCGASLNAVFAQRRNVLRPAFLGMVKDLLRFNRQATELALADAVPNVSLGEFLRQGGYRQEMIDWYLIPMAACVWSCPAEAMMQYPAGTFIRFCHNHGLLQGFEGRPQWYTVRGGSREYVRRIAAGLPDVQLNTPVLAVHRDGGLPQVQTASARLSFDAVLIATHSDQALQLLARPSAMEQQVLGDLPYQANRAVLHLDASVLPKRKRAWAAWNYESVQGADAGVCCHYLINKLQPLPFKQPVIVSLNPLREPSHILREFSYAHPLFDAKAVAAQARLPDIQGAGRVWFAGAWAGYGFHEDGLKAGLAAARDLRAQLHMVQAAAAE
jgi:predicted NAD/FAD-binding protein